MNANNPRASEDGSAIRSCGVLSAELVDIRRLMPFFFSLSSSMGPMVEKGNELFISLN